MIMKRIYIAILFCTVGLFTACSDFLDEKNPNDQSTDEFWKTEEELMKGLSAAYRPLRFNGEYGRWLHVLYISRSDEGYSASPNPVFTSYSDFKTQNNDQSEAVLYTWLDLYKGVFWANQVIDAADALPAAAISDELRARVIGEATFLRGMGYFHLAGVYGRGVITTTSLPETTRNIVEQDGLYEQARKDFELAAEEGRLPAVYDGKDVGRITRGGALGMLSKVYAQQHNWAKVEETCLAIFDVKDGSGAPLYGLVGNYNDNFIAGTENNKESLFEVQFKEGLHEGIGVGCGRAKFFSIPGPSFDDASPRVIVKQDLELEKTLTNAPDPRLKATLFYYDQDNPNEQFYKKTWTGWSLNTNNSRVFWKKYTRWNTEEVEDFNCGINFRVVRLADIYLLYAEALNELDRTSESYAYINKVRNRVGLSDLENSTVFTGIGTDKVKMRDQIMHERFCELAGECWRWLDLERWGAFEDQTKIDWLKTRDSEFNNFVIGKSNRFPIPYRDIPLVQGLTQNPGY